MYADMQGNDHLTFNARPSTFQQEFGKLYRMNSYRFYM